MSIIESLRDYILTFPDLPAGAVQIDYLGSEPGQFTLERVPGEPVLRQYTDGGCIKQFLFMFASRMYYGADVDQCAENQALFEAFEAWIEENARGDILPDLPAGMTPVRLEVTSSGYVFSESADSARYQMQLRLTYRIN